MADHDAETGIDLIALGLLPPTEADVLSTINGIPAELAPFYLIFQSGLGGGDTVSPEIGNYTPPLLTQIAKNQAIEFDVTDNSGEFTRIVVVCNFAETGIEEVVHDGDEFRGAYKGKSSRSAIQNGFRYTVMRGAGGWIDDPDFRCFAIDRAGNEAP